MGDKCCVLVSGVLAVAVVVDVAAAMWWCRDCSRKGRIDSSCDSMFPAA